MVLRLKNVLKGQGFQVWELGGLYRGLPQTALGATETRP